MWFNTVIILDHPLPVQQQTREHLSTISDMLMEHHATWNNEDHGKWDNTQDYIYGPVTQFSPAYTHAIVTPEGLWLDPGKAPESQRKHGDFPELDKVYWERDTAKAEEELACLRARETPLWDAREARWQKYVQEVFETFKDSYALWVRCHI